MRVRRSVPGRRACLAAGVLAAISRPLLAQSDRPLSAVYMGVAGRKSDAANLELLQRALQDPALNGGLQVQLDALFADGDIALAERQMKARLARPVDVFVAPGPAAVRLILRTTREVPIVAVGLHPHGGQTDLFDSLARPGGMVTGVSNFGEQLAAKRLQLLVEAVPGLAAVGVLHNSTESYFRRWGEETEQEIRGRQLRALRVGLTSNAPQAAIDAVAGLRARGAQALIVVRDFLTASLREVIIEAALHHKLPIIAEERDWPVSGALMSYGANNADLYRRAASYVVRVLRGARPATLPIEQATLFELVINLKTARDLGIAPPKSLMLRADEVIG